MASNTTPHGQQQQSDFHTAANPHIDHISYTTSENQLAGLVQAATAAAGQADSSDWATAAAAAAAAAGQQHLESYSTELHLPDDGFDESAFGSLGSPTNNTTGRHNNRASIADGQNGQQQQQGLSRAVSKKRKRGDETLDPALTGMADQNEQRQQQQQQQQQQGQQQAFDGSEFGESSRSQSHLTDARSAGVHSAAALFRQPSSNKKYTRPPISRLYASLELSPENFLHLQAAAKNYMLDDSHPDRRECVGQRGKGDTELVKLRLWNCVRDFLENEGHGERFFGENVVNEGMPPRQYIWPRDQHKIISLVIPLLRRMVTNERQRQYAIETRKGFSDPQSEDRKRKKTDEIVNTADSTERRPVQESQSQQAQAGQQAGQQGLTQPTVQQNEHQHAQNHYVPPPPPLPQNYFSGNDQLGINLSPLVLDGYSTDWNAVSQTYNMYNQNYQLDTLWGVSGLQQPDWWGLVAAVDSHWKVIHDGNPTQCSPQCEEYHLNQILTSNEIAQLDWRIGGSALAPARIEFANSVTRDLDRIIKESLIHKQEKTGREAEQPPPTEHAPFLSAMHQSTYGAVSTHDHHHPHPSDTSPITLRLNVIQDSKRIVPRLDITAEQCPDLASVRSLIAHRWSGQLPASTCDENGNVDTSKWKVQVWLPEGLVTADNDGDWTIAQLSAGTIDWMDNDLRVVVDLSS